MTPTISESSDATQKLIEQAKLLSEDEQTQIVDALLFDNSPEETDWSEEIARRVQAAEANPGTGLTREESEKAIRAAMKKVGFEL